MQYVEIASCGATTVDAPGTVTATNVDVDVDVDAPPIPVTATNVDVVDAPPPIVPDIKLYYTYNVVN